MTSMISMAGALLIIHYAATLIMTGAIWLAQLSLYPLLALVGRETFPRYQAEHVRRISAVAWTFIYIELITGIALVFYSPPEIPLSLRLAGMVLIALIFATTWGIQYPIHKKLMTGWDARLHSKLVQTNWIRTIGWTARAILLTVALGRMI